MFVSKWMRGTPAQISTNPDGHQLPIGPVLVQNMELASARYENAQAHGKQ